MSGSLLSDQQRAIIAQSLSMLKALQQRSKYQHRHQIFYRHLQSVVKLIRSDGWMHSRTNVVQARALVLRAACSCQNMLKARHFVPLQAILIANYSRLHVFIASVLDSLDTHSGTSAMPAPSPLRTEFDVGEVVKEEDSAHTSRKRARDDLPAKADKKVKKIRRSEMDDIFGV